MYASRVPNTIVVVGATSAIAMECARIWMVNGGKELILVGRNREKLNTLATELRSLNSKATITCYITEFLDSEQINALANNIFQSGPVDIALIAHGFLPDPTEDPHDLTTVAATLEISGLSPCLFAEAFARRMEEANHGTLALIGSVAGDRARKSNYPYGAAKGMTALYMDGLRHRLARTKVRLVLIKPGPTDTPLATHHKRKGVSLANPAQVARDIVSGIAKGTPVIYTPRYWRLVMALVRLIPRWIFMKMDV